MSERIVPAIRADAPASVVNCAYLLIKKPVVLTTADYEQFGLLLLTQNRVGVMQTAAKYEVIH